MVDKSKKGANEEASQQPIALVASVSRKAGVKYKPLRVEAHQNVSGSDIKHTPNVRKLSKAPSFITPDRDYYVRGIKTKVIDEGNDVKETKQPIITWPQLGAAVLALLGGAWGLFMFANGEIKSSKQDILDQMDKQNQFFEKLMSQQQAHNDKSIQALEKRLDELVTRNNDNNNRILQEYRDIAKTVHYLNGQVNGKKDSN